MVLTPDQDRVRMMLKDTITLLCKNGLQFKNKFCIDAVIGITLDDDEVFLVSMNELISSGKVKPASEEDSSSGEERSARPGRKAKRRKRSSHRRRMSSEESSTEPVEDGEFSSRLGDLPTAPKVIKGERDVTTCEEDLVFIKQERKDNENQWSQSTSPGVVHVNTEDFSNLCANPPEIPNFPLSDLSVMQVGSEQSSGLWDSHEHSQFNRSRTGQSLMAATGSIEAQQIQHARKSNQTLSPGDFVEQGDPQDYDVGARYKWHWDWLSLILPGQPPLSHCFRKLKSAGVAYCMCCDRNIFYRHRGISVLKEHVTCKRHKLGCSRMRGESRPIIGIMIN